MADLERLASFYLGQEYDLASGEMLDNNIHYDARDLTTHAVCLGMTGSGKTGLGVILLEEATLDGVPSLIIDPKGDMTNLLLTFPDLKAEDFAPWVNPDDARRKDMDQDAYAGRMADLWRKGLAGTDQGPERIRRLKDAADFVIYTPGSSAGHQLSILDTLKAPALSWDTDSELLRDKIESIVTALLALIDIEADAVRSREHILLSNIFEHAWKAGQDLELADLILQVQNPPFTQLGIFPVDTFFPERDRMELAMLLNGLLASPAFADWIQGQPLDIDNLLHSPTGKPQVSILYIAHLSETEKQFFVTLLLEQVVSWMRAQTGTTSLRALVYMDEVFGYLPPHPSNPPTKKPMLTLLKQARAFGLGLILATQNPVDLDYKALSNAGTWFIGRMQADRDKQRLLDGLEGVEATGSGLKRSDFDKMISAVKSRVFLLHNVHESQPVVFHTRWAMSYLRGPLTRPQVQQLMAGKPPQAAAALAHTAPQPAAHGGASKPAPSAASVAAPPVSPTPEPQDVIPYHRVPAQLPSSVKQVFLSADVPLRTALAEMSRNQGWTIQSDDAYLLYHPSLVGTATIRYAHNTSRQSAAEEASYLLVLEGDANIIDWDSGKATFEIRDLERQAEDGAYFAQLPTDLGESKRHTALKKEFEDHLYYSSSMALWHNTHLKLFSEFGESEEEFQKRCSKAAKKARDAEVKKLVDKYDTQIDRLEDKMRREERELEEDKADHSARKQEELLSGVESVVGLFSRRRSTRGLSTASRRRRMTQQAKADIRESEEEIDELEDEISEMKQEANAEAKEIHTKWAELVVQKEEVEVRPRRADVRINLFALAWLPHWQVGVGEQVISMPAFEVEPA